MQDIVLVHGLFGSLSDPAIVGAFGDAAARVLAPDLLGYGAFRDHAAPDWSLADQADHLAGWLAARGIAGPVHLVGHSVGGAVAMLLARRHPGRVLSLTSVEGNFTLRDAFWSQRIARLPLDEVAAEVAAFRADPAGWIGRAGVVPTAWTVSVAAAWLDNQPVATVRAQARAVVAATGDAAFLDGVRALLDGGLRLNLLAGGRSRAGWSVPDWVVARAAGNRDVAGAGHLMMLEDARGFAEAVLAGL